MYLGVMDLTLSVFRAEKETLVLTSYYRNKELFELGEILSFQTM